jgi:hypothetical protein
MVIDDGDSTDLLSLPTGIAAIGDAPPASGTVLMLPTFRRNMLTDEPRILPGRWFSFIHCCARDQSLPPPVQRPRSP